MTRDRGKVEIYAHIAVTFAPDIKNPRISRKSNEECLHFRITNIGRRPINVSGLAFKKNWWAKKGGVIICTNLPKMLNEGEVVDEIFYVFDVIKEEPWSIYAYDSTGKNYKVKRKVLKRIYKKYREKSNPKL